MNYPDFSGILKSGAIALLASFFLNGVNFKETNKPIVQSEQLIQNRMPRPFYLPSAHLETIVPSVFFKPTTPDYERERIILSDGDFLDLDWLRNDNSRLIVISHGMEGDSHRPYVTRACNYFSDRSWDVLAWNQRGCSGEQSLLPIISHHGSTIELKEVVDHTLKSEYSEIVLLGFSMGGCQTLKYLSTHPIDDRVKGAIGFSVTFDFEGMMQAIELPSNRIYKKSFLEKIKNRIISIDKRHSGLINIESLDSIKSLEQLHNQFTLKLNGYSDLDEFYYDASPSNFMAGLSKPMLIVNAKNDPFLGAKNYPDTEGVKNLTVIYTKHGGHVGFSKPFSTASYMEDLTLEFIKDLDE